MIQVYGAPWCPDCKRSKRFLAEQRITFDWIDIEQRPDGAALVRERNQGKQIIPTIVFDDGSFLAEPTNADLAAKLGIRTEPAVDAYDLVVVGGGPAGLTAALYAAREGIRTLVVERSGVGGQAGVTERIDNFPGFPEGISGADFADRLHQQVTRFGAEVLAAQNVAAIALNGRYRTVRMESGTEVCCTALLLTPGSTYRRLGVPGEEDFIGAGVHFCATCDGPFYRGQEVMVVGGGNSAAEESLFLTQFSPSVTLVTRSATLSASAIAREKVEEKAGITLIPRSTVAEFRGEGGRLASVVLQNLETGALTELRPKGVFVFIGQLPNNELAKGLVELDRGGFIVTGKGLETSVPGIFAAGDARSGSTKQAASAVGEGATAALAIRDYLRTQ